MRIAASTVALCVTLSARAASADAFLGAHAESLELTTVATGMTQATDVRFLPDGRAILTELEGRVLLLQGDGSLVVAGHLDAVLPLENGETGLLALEVHPEFESTRLLYFYHSVANTKGGTPKNRDRLVSMVLRPDDTLDLASEAGLLDGLESPAGIHHGGGLSIGPDRCLCKILRIALDGSIPPDNPLVGVGNVPACGDTCESMPSTVGAPREAIWAWGFRNPFRLWVDPKTGIPWVADVEERAFEEIDLARRGGHYGWPWREGRHGYPIGRGNRARIRCTSAPTAEPVQTQAVSRSRAARSSTSARGPPPIDGATGSRTAAARRSRRSRCPLRATASWGARASTSR